MEKYLHNSNKMFTFVPEKKQHSLIKGDKTMKQITILFYEYKMVGMDTKATSIKHIIKTGKKTMAEAFDVACANGLNPSDTCKFIWED